MRAHEAAVAGACVLNERGNASLAHDFRPDLDYATYGEDLEEVIEALLADGDRRLEIATAGQAAALPWTYEARLAQTVTAVRALLDGGAGGAVPAGVPVLAEQWRLVPDRGGRRAGGRALRAAGAETVEALRPAPRGAGGRVRGARKARCRFRLADLPSLG
jgi:hypothetical protein